MVSIINNYPDYDYYTGTEGGQSFSLSPAICIFLVVGVVVSLVGVGFLALGYVADQSTGDVNVIIQLSGDDLLVTLVDGGESRQIQVLTTYVEGYADASSSVRNPKTGETVTFPKMGEGISGDEFVIVEAQLDDGSEVVVDYVRLRFS